MRSEHIRALTGVRFFAALWVVVYHSNRYNQDVLVANYPNLHSLVYPLTGAGFRGVDLFFMLSGFVLALNYSDRLGARVDLRGTLRFLWLRLARIWPLYMLVILTAGLLRIVRHELWESAPVAALTGSNLLRQALLVQQWFPPEKGAISWVGPAWSLSAEWLAYLLFPLFVLVVFRARGRLRARSLLVLALLSMVPLLVGVAMGGSISESVWLLRILCEFVAGMLVAAAASRLELTARVRRIAGHCALLSVLAIVVWLYVVQAFAGPSWWSTSVVVLFVPLVLGLAIGTGPLHDLLATKALVLGGGLSYALYLVHSPLLYLFRDVIYYTDTFRLTPLQRYYAELAFIPVMVLAAWLLFRFFEEPVRKLMRRMLDVRLTRARPVP